MITPVKEAVILDLAQRLYTIFATETVLHFI